MRAPAGRNDGMTIKATSTCAPYLSPLSQAIFFPCYIRPLAIKKKIWVFKLFKVFDDIFTIIVCNKNMQLSL